MTGLRGICIACGRELLPLRCAQHLPQRGRQ
nr:MAG TPA: SAGA-associated factor 11-FINGER, DEUBIQUITINATION, TRANSCRIPTION FACTOR, SAGA [Caudoviricetes sp.]